MLLQGSAEKMLEKAAWLIYKEGIEILLAQQSSVVIAVPGGRSVTKIFRELKKFSIDWSRVHIFMLDERLVPVDHQDSNFRLVSEQLREYVGKESLHPFTFPPESPEQGCEEYGEELNRFGGRFDIVLGSSGEDGHIASLFPGRAGIEDDSRGFLLVDDSPKPPSKRMTAGKRLIADAQVGFLLFIGSGKKDALQHFLSPDTVLSDSPSKIITQIPVHFIFTDQEIGLP